MRSMLPLLAAWTAILCCASASDRPTSSESASPNTTKPKTTHQDHESVGTKMNTTQSGDAGSDNHSAPSATKENHLAGESSPYLLMHVHNPVDWYPWGPEALEKARKENKLIFLSVGYSSCHWCHVMEQESFQDPEIAALLNEHFVSIKVDREERPDLDKIYMMAVQFSQQGRGGWPMTVFLTPDAKPFLGATYLPARDNDRPGSTGFLTVIGQLHQAWTTEPKRVQEAASTLSNLVKTELEREHTEDSDAKAPLDKQILNRVQRTLAEQFDPEHGGFGYSPVQPQRPKFPEPSNLVFLLHRIESQNASEKAKTEARMMLTATLDKMAAGGIYDHLGGGFHRYSVDRFWRIPHFEKMLYDNGQLASVYAEAYRLTNNENYARVARGIADYVLREMTDKQGGFYAALDADSEHVEGKFYRWTPAEVRELLSPDEYTLFSEVYGLTGPPNFEDHFHVPMLPESLEQSAKQRDLTEQELVDKLTPIRAKLLEARDSRVRPLTDTKILTSWNGLMIRGLADAGRLLDEPRYIEAAANAADFLLDHLRTEEGRLLRTFGEGRAKLNAYLTDYAFAIDGLIALHQASGEPRWLQQADKLLQHQIQLFAHDRGGFYFTSHDHESLLARTGDAADNVQPSGNSISASNLLYLSQALNKPEYSELAEKTILAAMGTMKQLPTSMPRMAVELERRLTAKNSDEEVIQE